MAGSVFDNAIHPGVEFTERDGVIIPRTFGNLRAECEDISEGAGVLDLCWFGLLSIRGLDRVSWLHKLTTANVEALGEGRGTYALLLNATGHVVGDFVVIVRRDELILYSSKSAQERLAANLNRAIFREKVSLRDISGEWSVLTLQGSRSEEVLHGVSESDVPSNPFDFGPIGDGLAVRNSRTGGKGFDILVPAPQSTDLWQKLTQMGARPVGLDALNAARIEACIPWFGDDFDESMLALEASLDPFIPDNKGCYTGQEVIARIRNRGHVNRLLVQLRVQGDVIPLRGDNLESGDREVGWITSSAWSFRQNAPLALGYIRREFAQPGTAVQILRADNYIDAAVNRSFE